MVSEEGTSLARFARETSEVSSRSASPQGTRSGTMRSTDLWVERNGIRLYDLSDLRSQLEFSNAGVSFHTNGGAMPKVLEPPAGSACDFSNPGARQTAKHPTETRTSRASADPMGLL